MKRLLLQSDDYGITRAVSDGILRGVKEGIIRNTGMFVNMPSSEAAAKQIKNERVCLGIDINYVAGKPVSKPEQVPHLVDEKGDFYSSGEQLRRHRLLGMDGIIYQFEQDPYPYEEILLETENQVKRFYELIGRWPEYLHPHSVCTPNTERAAREIADKYQIYHTTDMMNDPVYRCLPGAVSLAKGVSLEEQMRQDVETELLEIGLPALQEGETGYYIFHCGYLDADLFRVSSLTIKRMLDLKAALSDRIRQYLKQNDIELITYRELRSTMEGESI